MTAIERNLTDLSNKINVLLGIKEELSGIKKELSTVQRSLSEQKVDFQEMLRETELSMMTKIDSLRVEFKKSMEDSKKSQQKLEKRIDRRFKDIESDNRSTQAIARLVQDAGLSFKDTRIPYPLQGNAAIEDIKDYY